jgi:hypothetical protein
MEDNDHTVPEVGGQTPPEIFRKGSMVGNYSLTVYNSALTHKYKHTS